MFNQKIYDLVGKLVVDFGVEINLESDVENKLYFNLNTQAKSHMHLYIEEDKLVVKKRYNEEDSLTLDETVSVEEIISWLAYNYTTCIHGRSFGSEAWDKLCAKYDITVKYGCL